MALADGRTDARPARSLFVNVVGWVFTGLGTMVTCISLMQIVMLSLFFPNDLFEGLRHVNRQQWPSQPPWAEFINAHFQWIPVFFFVVSVTTLVSAVGLLKRKNWARRLFLGGLGFGIVYCIGAIGLHLAYPMTPLLSDEFPVAAREAMRFTSGLILAYTIVMSAAMIALFAWMIRRLCSAEIRREFASP